MPRAKPLEIRSIKALPDRLAVGRGTALFLDGRCSHPDAPIADLSVLVNGVEHPALGVGMPPPPDLLADDDYWWSIVPFAPVAEARPVELCLRAGLAGGGVAFARLGTIQLRPAVEVDGAASCPLPEPIVRESSATAQKPPALIAICMATYEPPLDLFERQIASIRAQTHRNWVCVISDDCSRPERVAKMHEVLGDDERFRLSRAPQRLGFYRNFERALALAPPQAPYVALADQDDRWYPQKLEELRSNLRPGSRLAYSDMRIVARDGRLISDTYWVNRRNNHDDFGSLLLANTVTGAASLYAREVLDYALPFPPALGDTYHDHWLALVAMALGPVTYLDRPLYDYVQHEAAALGHARANAVRRSGDGERRMLFDLLTRRRRFGRLGRALYFNLYCRTAITARVLEMRCGRRMAPDKRRTLRRFGDSTRGLAWLAARSARPLLGRTETLGRERAMLGALVWRRVVEWRARLETLRRLRAGRLEPGAAPGAQPPSSPVPAAAKKKAAAGGASEAWLVPILVDYFTRDGSTLMMKLLASSPQIAVENVYPYERKYFSYLWRWSRMLERTDWPEDVWGPSAMGSIAQEHRVPLIGPLPWTPRSLIESSSREEAMSRHCFELAWQEFSRRAIRWERAQNGSGNAPIRYYAEKHLNTWLVDPHELPAFRVIALLRDPRDTYASIVAFDQLMNGRSGFGSVEVGSREHVAEIVGRQRQRLRWIAKLLDRGEVPVIRYEDMVNDLGGVARTLEDWLDVELDARAVLADRQMRKVHVSARSPEESIGRWPRDLDPEVASIFSEQLAPELQAVGLEP